MAGRTSKLLWHLNVNFSSVMDPIGKGTINFYFFSHSMMKFYNYYGSNWNDNYGIKDLKLIFCDLYHFDLDILLIKWEQAICRRS